MTFVPENTNIGFIGIGVMGKSMARHLMQGGYRMHIYTRTKAKAADLIDGGAHWEDSIASLASKCKVIFTIVGFPADVEEVYLGEQGILANIQPGGYVVDMTTSRPDLAERIAKEAAMKDIHALDAPCFRRRYWCP